MTLTSPTCLSLISPVRSSFYHFSVTNALYEGLIANAEAGNEGDIQLVESLVSDYISRDSCLILLTITCECEDFSLYVFWVFTQSSGDFMTQKSYQLAQKHDPNGERTIGRSFSCVSRVEADYNYPK